MPNPTKTVNDLMEPARPMPLIPSTMERMFEGFNHLQDNLQLLADRLEPILNPMDDDASIEAGRALGPNASPVARRLEDAISVISTVDAKIQLLLQRVEV